MQAAAPANTEIDYAKAYEDTKLLIYKTCHRFAHAYGLQFEDLLSLAHTSFMAACRSWKPGKGTKLSTYICWWVTCDIKTHLQKQRRGGVPLELNEEIVGTFEEHHSFMDDFLTFLSDDAKVIAQLIVEAPKDFQAVLADTTREVANISKRQVRDVVREVLMDRGWTPGRITSAFNEISTALA